MATLPVASLKLDLTFPHKEGRCHSSLVFYIIKSNPPFNVLDYMKSILGILFHKVCFNFRITKSLNKVFSLGSLEWVSFPDLVLDPSPSYSSLWTSVTLILMSRHRPPLSGQDWFKSFWNHTKRQEPRFREHLSDWEVLKIAKTAPSFEGTFTS